MLEQIDLSRKLSRQAYKACIDGLERKLGRLQREAVELGIPVAVVFEGWDAAGKGTLINRMILCLDPRGFNVYSAERTSREERLRPYLWRFWVHTPARGRMAVFDRSWYGRVLVDRVERRVKKAVWSKAYDDINNFERHLADDGCVIVKLFLHISRKKQEKRFKKLESKTATAWRVTAEDWRQNDKYDRYAAAVEDMLAKTDSAHAPWTLVEAHDRRHATVKVLRTAIAALEARTIRLRAGEAAGPTRPAATENAGEVSVLDTLDLGKSLSRERYERELDACQDRVRELTHLAYLRRVPVVVVYEGWDAAGKGGNIRRLAAAMDPRGYDVVPVGVPDQTEKSHHYLWRFWRDLPKAGHTAIFDRSWYGRVLVERVESLCSEAAWRRAYHEINEMEAQWCDAGAVLVKFWLHISPEEQLRRFRARERTPHKRWKITEEDWRNREKWDAYREAVDAMLRRTSTRYAPWTVVEANCKLYARVKALKTVIACIEAKVD